MDLDLGLLLLNLFLPGGGEEDCRGGTSKGERESGGSSWRETKVHGRFPSLGFT